jgi:hypothetical protein
MGRLSRKAADAARRWRARLPAEAVIDIVRSRRVPVAAPLGGVRPDA